MKDCKGQRICFKSVLKVINDVDYGKEYTVDRFCEAHPILGIYIDGVSVPLNDFEIDDDGNLIDFERITNKGWFYENEKKGNDLCRDVTSLVRFFFSSSTIYHRGFTITHK